MSTKLDRQPPDAENERLARAVCLAWGWNPDEDRWDGGSRMIPAWRSHTVQRQVLSFVAMQEVETERRLMEATRG